MDGAFGASKPYCAAIHGIRADFNVRRNVVELNRYFNRDFRNRIAMHHQPQREGEQNRDNLKSEIFEKESSQKIHISGPPPACLPALSAWVMWSDAHGGEAIRPVECARHPVKYRVQSFRRWPR